MATTRVRGFTLVEMLVVIAIIGTLVALLLPAVQRARESSRRSSCLNNVRQLAIGTQHYEDRFRRYPGLFEPLDATRFAVTSQLVGTTWAVILLPEIERQSVYDSYASGKFQDIYVEAFVCPSDGAKSHTGAEISYVANGGRLGSVTTNRIPNGPFVNRIFHTDLAALEGHWVDGREYTLIYSENSDATFYDEIGWNLFASPDTIFDDDFLGKDRAWNPAFFWSSVSGENIAINAPGAHPSEVRKCERHGDRRYTSSSCSFEPGRAAASYARPSSYHGGGVNVAFASGRAMFIREGIDYQVYIALMTLNDRKSDSPNPQFILEDKHLR